MNCREFDDWMGPWLSGEIEAAKRAEFDAHRVGCASCCLALKATMAADEQVRRAVLSDKVRVTVPVAAAKKWIARRQPRQWIGIAAALLLTLAAAGYRMQSRLRPTGLLASAARDHKVEVTQASPRRWRIALTEVKPLLDDYRVMWSDVETLRPVGFVLQKAKRCGIDGKPTLHLVFSDGTRSMSVYVQKQDSGITASQSTVDGADVATFHRRDLTGVVVATVPGLCAEAVRRLSAM